VLIGIVSTTLVVGHEQLAALLETPEAATLLLVGGVYLVFQSPNSYTQTVFQGFQSGRTQRRRQRRQQRHAGRLRRRLYRPRTRRRRRDDGGIWSAQCSRQASGSPFSTDGST